MRKKTALNLLRGATVACALLTTVSIGAGKIAGDWADFIDATLGTTHKKIVNSTDIDPAERYKFVNEDITSTTELIAWHKDLAERMAEEGAVLLKNNTTAGKGLPLTGSSPKVTLLGIRSVNPVYGGNIGSSANTAQAVDYATALTEKGFDVNTTVVNAYKQMPADFGRDMSFGMVQSVSPKFKSGEAAIADVMAKESGWASAISNYSSGTAVVVIGRPSSEAANFYPGEDGLADKNEFDTGANFLGLSKNEKALIDYAGSTFSNVVVVVNSSCAMELEYAEAHEKVNSIVWIGDPGTYGLLGLADVLKGEVTPSGHLPDTYAVDSASSPAMVNFGLMSYKNYADYDGNTDNSKGFAFLDEAEGIYTGYRYYETRYEDQILNRYGANSVKGSSTGSAWNYDDEITYTFGYGLSYTTFKQEIVAGSFKDSGGKISIDVKVTNTGDTYPGKDVVQVYVQTPYGEHEIENHIEKSAIQLAGFEKTNVLYPASKADSTHPNSQTLTVTFDKKYIASYDYVNAKTYILSAGDYYLSIGNGAHEALNNVLKAKNANVDGDAAKTHKWNYAVINDTAYARANGVDVTNQLDDMNLNYWTGDKTKLWEGQLSRSNWNGTWPEGYTTTGTIRTTTLEATEAMQKELKNLAYEDIYAAMKDAYGTTAPKWGQSTGYTIGMMKGTPETPTPFDDPRWEQLLDTITLDEAVAFYTNGNSLFKNLDSIAFVGATLGDGPLGFGTSFKNNQNEDGDPAAVKADDPNSGYNLQDGALECLLGASFNKELLYEFGRRFGTDSLWANQVLLWGPGINVHRTPYNARNHEYYSEDPMLCNLLAAEQTKGSESLGLIVGVKHFSFNDQETNRTGVSVFMNEQRAREIELRAFQGAFEEGGAKGTMTAFNRVGVRFAGAHQGLMTNILRKEWGFDGYNITDMINGPMYMRADTSLLAGTTILDTTNNTTSTELIENIKNDPVVQNALRDALHRNLWAIVNSNTLNGVDNLSKVVSVMPWYDALILGLEIGFGVLTAAGIVGYVLVTLKKKDDEEAK